MCRADRWLGLGFWVGWCVAAVSGRFDFQPRWSKGSIRPMSARRGRPHGVSAARRKSGMDGKARIMGVVSMHTGPPQRLQRSMAKNGHWP